MHEHEFQGQKLRHGHAGGDLPHGYFEHPEDGFPVKSTAPMADALAEVDRAAADGGFTAAGEMRPHLHKALWTLAEAVRASLLGVALVTCEFCRATGVVLVAALSADPDQLVCGECHADPRVPTVALSVLAAEEDE